MGAGPHEKREQRGEGSTGREAARRAARPIRRGRAALAALGAVALLAAGAAARAQAPQPGAPDADHEADHEIRLPAEDRASPGQDRALSLAIVPRPGHTISREGPLIVELRPGRDDTGLHLPRRRYQRPDAADPHAEAPRFDLRYRATAPGRHRLAVDVRFWVCARRTCRPVHATREVVVDVAPPAAPDT